MRLLVCEFVTGGGMPADEPIPAGLAHEGDLMLRALLDDLLDGTGDAITVTRDARLPPLPPHPRIRSITVDGPEAAWAQWEDLAGAVDAVWPVAPETDGALERLSRLVVGAGARLLTSAPDTVAVTASKAATAALLAGAGIAVAPTLPARAVDEPPGDGPWVVKPDDGAGCVDTRVLSNPADWRRWRAESRGEAAGPGVIGYVLQPFIAGTPVSLSLLCRAGRAWPLTVNRQTMTVKDGALVYRGGEVGGLPLRPALTALADAIAAALPGLAGYVGVDLVLTDSGPVVLEVNPRLTTSYVGLRRAIGRNVAAEALALLADPSATPAPVRRAQPVTITLDD